VDAAEEDRELVEPRLLLGESEGETKRFSVAPAMAWGLAVGMDPFLGTECSGSPATRRLLVVVEKAKEEEAAEEEEGDEEEAEEEDEEESPEGAEKEETNETDGAVLREKGGEALGEEGSTGEGGSSTLSSWSSKRELCSKKLVVCSRVWDWSAVKRLPSSSLLSLRNKGEDSSATSKALRFIGTLTGHSLTERVTVQMREPTTVQMREPMTQRKEEERTQSV